MKKTLFLLALSTAAHAEQYRLTDIQQLTSAAYTMNPVVLSTGEVCYSEWDGYGQRAVSHTPSNMWWLRCMNQDGTNNHVVLGAHGSPTFKTRAYLTGIVDPARSGEGSTQFKLLRPMSEIKRGVYSVTSYYRSNHIGATGMIYGFTLSNAEGFSQSAHLDASDYKSTADGSGRFAPNVQVLTPFSNDQDISNYGTKFRLPLKPGEPGKAMGRAGMAAASVDGEYIYTHGRGSCYEGTMPEFNTREAMGGEPTCQFQIRKALVKQITDPFNPAQSVVIACADEKYNCRDARYVVPYAKLFGIAAPGAQ